jgi:hypothetical protein
MGQRKELADLYNDGDTVELGDGRELRLRIEPDDINPFDEFDTYGKIAWSGRVNDYGYEQRPAGFDGNAERITILNDRVWWQPPADVKRSDPHFRELRALVSDLASFGCVGVSLELLEGEDAYGRPIVRRVASLWGIDSLANGYLAEVVSELAAELEVA